MNLVRVAAVLMIGLAATARAQTPSCFDTAADQAALIQCAKNELVPLESQTGDTFRRLQQQFANNPALLEALKNTQQQWNAWRDSKCSAEGKAHAGAGSMESQRALMACIRREFEQRLKELEAL